jgi:hypothetical protein
MNLRPVSIATSARPADVMFLLVQTKGLEWFSFEQELWMMIP